MGGAVGEAHPFSIETGISNEEKSERDLKDLNRSAGGSQPREYSEKIMGYGYGSIPMKIQFLMGWTSINPSYFDVNKKGVLLVLTHCHINGYNQLTMTSDCLRFESMKHL